MPSWGSCLPAPALAGVALPCAARTSPGIADSAAAVVVACTRVVVASAVPPPQENPWAWIASAIRPGDNSARIVTDVQRTCCDVRVRGADAVELFDAAFEHGGAAGCTHLAGRSKMCECRGPRVILCMLRYR